MRAHRHGDLRRTGGTPGALHHHRRDGWRHGHPRHHRRLRPLLARRRRGCARRHGLRLLRGDARHGLGQRLPGDHVPVVWRHRADRDRPRHGRLLGRDGIAARGPRHGASAHPRADIAAVLLQLHVHSAVDDRVSAHHHLLSDRTPHGTVQADRGAVSALHPGHLAAVRVPGCGGQLAARRAANRGEARGAPSAGCGAGDAFRGRTGIAPASGVGRRCRAGDAREIRTALDRRYSRRRHHGRGDGQ